MDYDGCRHNLETIQAASKKRDDIKVAKAREQLEESRRLYEVLNKELHEELPALYDSRIPFFVNAFHTLFGAETHFHAEYSKVYQQFVQLIEELAIEGAKGTFQADANRYLAQAAFYKAKNAANESQYSPSQNHNTSGGGSAAIAAGGGSTPPPLSPAQTSKTSYELQAETSSSGFEAQRTNGDNAEVGTGVTSSTPDDATNGGTVSGQMMTRLRPKLIEFVLICC